MFVKHNSLIIIIHKLTVNCMDLLHELCKVNNYSQNNCFVHSRPNV